MQLTSRLMALLNHAFLVEHQQETHCCCTMENASRRHGSIAAAFKTPWRDGAKKPIKIDVPEISTLPHARLASG